MAHTRNFAELGLPDIDSAPQEYKTPDLVDDDGSSSPTRSTSATSSYKDLDEDDELEKTASRIERPNLHPSVARSHFARSKVDAKRADFSDRLHPSHNSIKPRTRSYRVTSRRRRRKDGGEEFASGRFSDEEDGAESAEDEETLEQRIARLKREVEEVQAEASKVTPEAEQDEGPEAGNNDTQHAMAHLSAILKTLDTSSRRSKPTIPLTSSAPHPQPTTPKPPLPSDTLQPLQRAASLESRLASLESALGIPTTSPLTPSSTNKTNAPPPKPVLASLSLLETQLSIISATTAPSLDSLSRQIATLTQDAQRLADARSATTASSAAPPPSAPSTTTSDRPRSGIGAPKPSADVDAATTAKVAALHAALPQIERLAPLLPALLERLRSLRALHAQAGVAGEQLAGLEKLQARCADEIERWRAGLERVEAAVRRAEEGGTQNRGAVEAWVRDLEGRVEGLRE